MNQANSVLHTGIYQSLALIYDDLMHDIDYEYWSDFIDALIQKHHPDAVSVLELACGTGSLALSLDELACYDITATDQSREMIGVAQRKGDEIASKVKFRQLNFTDITVTNSFDIVLMLFDSINYMLHEEDIVHVINQVHKILNCDGYFIFDFTTPSNSEKSEKLLNEKNVSSNGYRFERKSRYDKSEGFHYNEFFIEQINADNLKSAKKYHEIHKQRVYTLDQMIRIIKESNMNIVAMYDALELFEANNKSDRITMVLQ